MKIVQNPETGEVQIELENDEMYDIEIEEHLDALMEFVTQQAVEVHKLTNRYKELIRRLDEVERLSILL